MTTVELEKVLMALCKGRGKQWFKERQCFRDNIDLASDQASFHWYC